MHFSFIISPLSNLLFFIQKTDIQFLARSNLQNHLANGALNLSYFEKNEKKIWKQIEKLIGQPNIKLFRKAVICHKSIFTPYWHKASEHLTLWKRYFQNNQSLLQQIIVDIQKLCNVKSFKTDQIPIFLISNPMSNNKEIDAWFSWTPKQIFIVIEIPFNLKVSNSLFPLSILIHEFFHLILRKNKNLLLKISKFAEKNKKLLTKLSEDVSNRIFLEELLISSFIPEGYLSEKYFHTKVISYTLKPKDLLSWRKFVAFKLYPMAKTYIYNDRQIDEKYLKNLIKIIKHTVK